MIMYKGRALKEERECTATFLMIPVILLIIIGFAIAELVLR